MRPALFTGRPVVAQAASVFGITLDELRGECTRKRFCKARWAAMLVLHRRGWSYSRIATVVGRANHTTCHHGVKQAKRLEIEDSAFAGAVKKISAPIRVPRIKNTGAVACAHHMPFPGHRTMAEIMEAEEHAREYEQKRQDERRSVRP